MGIGIVYSHFSEKGGVENVILNQAEMLQSKGHDVKCYFAYIDRSVLTKTSNPYCYMSCYYPINILSNSKSARIVLSLPLAPLALKNLSNTDVLICHGYGPAPWIGYVQKKLRGTKYVSYIHFLPRMFYLDRRERELWCFDSTRKMVYRLSRTSGPLVKKLDSLGVSNSDHILVNSSFTGRGVRRAYGINPTVCYPPVDVGTFKKLSSEENRRFQNKFNRPLIFSSGRIVAIKHWEWLIKALPYIKKVFPSFNLVIAGDILHESERYFQELTRLSERLGVKENVKFLGFVSQEELVQLYNMADVYAYAAAREDFGLGPVEAMACGTPAVVWDDGAGPCETVIDGETGFRAEPYDVRDFGEKIMKALDVDKESVGNCLHNYVEKNFSCQRHLETLEGVIQNLL